MVDGVESNESSEESNISLSESVSSEIAVCRENALNTIQTLKHLPHSHVIGSLGPGKTRTVYSIVDLTAGIR